MPLNSIRAHFDCDGCGDPMVVMMDPADALHSVFPSLHKLAVDYARGGTYQTPPNKRHEVDMNMCSVQGGLVLCGNCTDIVDDATEEDPSEEQVRRALAGLRA